MSKYKLKPWKRIKEKDRFNFVISKKESVKQYICVECETVIPHVVFNLEKECKFCGSKKLELV